MTIIDTMIMAAAGIIVVRTVCLASKISARAWDGHPFHFAVIALGNSFVAVGAAGMVLCWPPASYMLLIGTASRLVMERRNR